jgi:hypothetical protein
VLRVVLAAVATYLRQVKIRTAASYLWAVVINLAALSMEDPEWLLALVVRREEARQVATVIATEPSDVKAVDEIIEQEWTRVHR